MKRQICLTIYIIISVHLCGQTNSIKIKKITDTINIVGEWKLIFHKTDGGQIIPLKSDEIETLIYYPDNKYFEEKSRPIRTSTWTLNQKKRELRYQNIQMEMTPGGGLVPAPGVVMTSCIDIMTADTLSIYSCCRPSPTIMHYYIRKK